MDLNKLRSDIRQHLQKRYIRTLRTEQLAFRIANAVIDGDLPWEQFFEEFVPYISSYAHPMMFAEERPFVVTSGGLVGTEGNYSHVRREEFFRVCADTVNGGWRSDVIGRMAVANQRQLLFNGILAFMGCLLHIDKQEHEIEDVRRGLLQALPYCCNVCISVADDAHLALISEAFQSPEARSGIRRLWLSFRHQPTVKIDLSLLRNLTWLTIAPDGSPRHRLDIVELVRAGTLVLPESVQCLRLEQGTGTSLHNSALMYGSIPLPDPRIEGSDRTLWPLKPLVDGDLADLADADTIAAAFKLTPAVSKALVDGLTWDRYERLTSWWQTATLELYVSLMLPQRLSLPSLVAYRGPIELLSPKGCPSLLFVEPDGGFVKMSTEPLASGYYSGHEGLFKAEVYAGWIKHHLSVRFPQVEAISTIHLQTKARKNINSHLSMVEESYDSVASYRRYYMGER